MKTGMVLEGGAMRGMFTSGVLDVMMENELWVDGYIGVSAGATFGCNYKSKQIGRAIRYNIKYCKDPRYCSVKSLVKTGDLFGEEFCYHTLPFELDIFDTDTFEKNPMEFYVAATDVHTGNARYQKLKDGLGKDLEWIRASASMPLASRIVHVDGYDLLDGGVADSVPLAFFRSIGYERNIVVLTQPKGFVKQKNGALPLIKKKYKKYPGLVEAMATRHTRYNEMIQYIEEEEKQGTVLVLRPPCDLGISRVEHDPDELQRVYDIGVEYTKENIDKIREFITQGK